MQHLCLAPPLRVTPLPRRARSQAVGPPAFSEALRSASCGPRGVCPSSPVLWEQLACGVSAGEVGGQPGPPAPGTAAGRLRGHPQAGAGGRGCVTLELMAGCEEGLPGWERQLRGQAAWVGVTATTCPVRLVCPAPEAPGPALLLDCRHRCAPQVLPPAGGWPGVPARPGHRAQGHQAGQPAAHHQRHAQDLRPGRGRGGARPRARGRGAP